MNNFKIKYNKIYKEDDHIATIRFNKLYVKKNKMDKLSRIYINKISLKLKLDIEYV